MEYKKITSWFFITSFILLARLAFLFAAKKSIKMAESLLCNFQNKKPRLRLFPQGGFEPPQSEPESEVLPLHNRGKSRNCIPFAKKCQVLFEQICRKHSQKLRKVFRREIRSFSENQIRENAFRRRKPACAQFFYKMRASLFCFEMRGFPCKSCSCLPRFIESLWLQWQAGLTFFLNAILCAKPCYSNSFSA